jgi:hypothetical protein
MMTIITMIIRIVALAAPRRHLQEDIITITTIITITHDDKCGEIEKAGQNNFCPAFFM